MKETKEIKEMEVEETVVEKKPAKKAQAPKPEPLLTYAVTRVNIRKGTSFESDVVRVIERGDEILVRNIAEGEKGTWAVVDEGFVKSEYLKKTD